MKKVNHSIDEQEFQLLCNMVAPFTFKDLDNVVHSVSLMNSGLKSDVQIPEMQFRTLCSGEIITIAKPNRGIMFRFALKDIGLGRIQAIIRNAI